MVHSNHSETFRKQAFVQQNTKLLIQLSLNLDQPLPSLMARYWKIFYPVDQTGYTSSQNLHDTIVNKLQNNTDFGKWDTCEASHNEGHFKKEDEGSVETGKDWVTKGRRFITFGSGCS